MVRMDIPEIFEGPDATELEPSGIMKAGEFPNKNFLKIIAINRAYPNPKSSTKNISYKFLN